LVREKVHNWIFNESDENSNSGKAEAKPSTKNSGDTAGTPPGGPDDDSGEPERKVRKPGQSGKEAANDIPSWAKGESPYVGENGKQFARKLLDNKYGAGNWKTGPGTEYNQLVKFADRAFMDPPGK